MLGESSFSFFTPAVLRLLRMIQDARLVRNSLKRKRSCAARGSCSSTTTSRTRAPRSRARYGPAPLARPSGTTRRRARAFPLRTSSPSS
ncbi:MAG: hypothetical protein EBZ77_09085 [Chitinophagia bacterium]|nr:hypothetical protein [Chitinophagia bacterium]